MAEVEASQSSETTDGPALRWEFTGEVKIGRCGRQLRQIRALVAIAALGVAVGDTGGWIEHEANLPQDGVAWVFERAEISGRWTEAKGGTFRGGTFRGGTFWGGTFRGGTFRGGTFRGGTFRGGTFRGGTFRGGTFEGGTFEGGTFEGGTFEGGTFRGGTFEGGTFRGGTFEGGTFRGGTFRGGTFWGGTFRGGTFEGGTFRGGTSITLPPVAINSLRWGVTITDRHMTIGCQHHELTRWWSFSDAQISRMDSEALEFWQAHRPMLEAICSATGRPLVEPVPAEQEAAQC